MNVYGYWVKRQQIAAKKVYSIDTGLVNAIGFSFPPNTGKLMENAAFLALRRTTHEIYYYTTSAGYEVDFYLPESGQLVQVAQSMIIPLRENERFGRWRMKTLDLSSGLILADSNTETIARNGVTITIRSLAVSFPPSLAFALRASRVAALPLLTSAAAQAGWFEKLSGQFIILERCRIHKLLHTIR